MQEVLALFPEATRIVMQIGVEEEVTKAETDGRKLRWSEAEAQAKELGGRLCYQEELREADLPMIHGNCWTPVLREDGERGDFCQVGTEDGPRYKSHRDAHRSIPGWGEDGNQHHEHMRPWIYITGGDSWQKIMAGDSAEKEEVERMQKEHPGTALLAPDGSVLATCWNPPPPPPPQQQQQQPQQPTLSALGDEPAPEDEKNEGCINKLHAAAALPFDRGMSVKQLQSIRDEQLKPVLESAPQTWKPGDPESILRSVAETMRQTYWENTGEWTHLWTARDGAPGQRDQQSTVGPEFHGACDGKGPTLTLWYMTADGQATADGVVIGGYVSESWRSRGAVRDDTAAMFLCADMANMEEEIVAMPVTPGCDQALLCYHGSHGPCMGHCDQSGVTTWGWRGGGPNGGEKTRFGFPASAAAPPPGPPPGPSIKDHGAQYGPPPKGYPVLRDLQWGAPRAIMTWSVPQIDGQKCRRVSATKALQCTAARAVDARLAEVDELISELEELEKLHTAAAMPFDRGMSIKQLQSIRDEQLGALNKGALNKLRLTLSSHPGRAVVFRDRIEHGPGHGWWLELGPADNACVVKRLKEGTEGPIMLADQPHLGLHIAEGPHQAHREKNAVLFGTWDHPSFRFNNDGTVSPSANPAFVLGYSACPHHGQHGRPMITFVKKASSERLIFDVLSHRNPATPELLKIKTIEQLRAVKQLHARLAELELLIAELDPHPLQLALTGAVDVPAARWDAVVLWGGKLQCGAPTGIRVQADGLGEGSYVGGELDARRDRSPRS